MHYALPIPESAKFVQVLYISLPAVTLFLPPIGGSFSSPIFH